MVKEAIKKIPKECKERCETLSKLINNDTISIAGKKEYRIMLNGYLLCLKDMGIININEKRGLCIYYKDKKWSD